MSLGAVANVADVRSSNAFCDRDFQCIRVVADSISRLCLALFYEILSLCSWVVSSAVSHHYASWASYQTNRAVNQLGAYLSFGSEVVDFCINSSTRVKELLPNHTTENEALRNIYGDAAIDRWSQIGTAKIPLDKARLSRREMASDGCCFGMSLDFISHYLTEVRSGKTPLQAVKAIAGRYVDGAPDEAQLAQTFYAALDTSSLLATEKAALEPNFNAKNDEVQSWLKAEQHRIKGLGHREMPEQLTNLQDQLAKKMQNLRTETIRDTFTIRAQVEEMQDEIMVNTFGCTSHMVSIYVCEEPNEDAFLEFEKIVNTLPHGTYHVGLSPDTHAGHAIVYIKTGTGEHFIHEPNFATLAIDPAASAARLWKIATDFYLKSGICSICFSACSLR